MNTQQLLQWGANPAICDFAGAHPQWLPGRVVCQEKDRYRLLTPQGECFASVSGKFRYQAQTVSEYPAVGDFVLADWPKADSDAVIHALAPRKTVLVRKAAGVLRQEQVVAANVDTVFLCMALNRDFNLRRLERYLSVAWDSGARSVVVLTKADLCDDLPEKLLAVEAAAPGTPIAATSILNGDGIEKILPYLHSGETVAFLGSSGVGKSTFINALLGENRLACGGLRNDDRGRHTTTHRELLFLPGGAMVIDTPGMRELGLWESDEGLRCTFSDIEALASSCKFKDCSHTSEPGCAIRAALQCGTLSEDRWSAYRKLSAENAYSENPDGYLAAKRKKFKEIGAYNHARRNR